NPLPGGVRHRLSFFRCFPRAFECLLDMFSVCRTILHSKPRPVAASPRTAVVVSTVRRTGKKQMGNAGTGHGLFAVVGLTSFAKCFDEILGSDLLSVRKNGGLDGIAAGMIDLGMAQSSTFSHDRFPFNTTLERPRDVFNELAAGSFIGQSVVEYIIETAEKRTVQQSGVVSGADDQAV